MAKIMFIKPLLETDATWEMVRTSSYLGMWFLSSHLKQKGHEVKYLDEVVRNNGLNNSNLFLTKLAKNSYFEEKLDISLEEYRRIKNTFFENNSPKDFVKKYTAFKNNEIVRTIAKTGNQPEKTLLEIEKFKPDFIGISLIASTNYRAATQLGRLIKEKYPNIKLFFGGQHFEKMSKQFLKDNTYVDYIIVGDAINVIDSLIEGKIEEKIINGGYAPLSDFPLLDFDIIKETEYPIDQAYSYPSFGRKSVDFMFSKGCFRQCDFCVAGSQSGNFASIWNWDKVDEQFKIFKANGIQELIIQDDAFIYGGMSNLIKKLNLIKKYDFYWQISGGFDFETLSTKITDLLISYNKSGNGRLTGIYMPFNPRTWNKGKSATSTMVSKHTQNFNNMKRLREEGGIYVFTSEIIGTPEHTRETIEQDIETHKEMIKHNYLDAALTLSATLLPGTKWFKENENLIINKLDYSGYSLFTTHHKTKNLSPIEIEELIVKRTKELNSIQNTYNWQTAFPNSKWSYKNK